MASDAYRELATLCKRRKLRLLIRIKVNSKRGTELTYLDVCKGEELTARATLGNLTLEQAAASVLNALELQEIK